MYWLRSRPAFGFLVFLVILLWMLRKRELEIKKTEQELELEKKNKKILEETFGITEENDDIKLYEAIMSNDITKLQKIKSINPTMNILKFNALIEHTEEEKLKRLEILIDKGIDLKFRDEEGMTALMYYAIGNKENNKDSKIIEILSQNGIDIDAQNDSGMTALMLCSIKNRPASVQILIDNGADINIKQNLTAKELAATQEIKDIINTAQNHSPQELVKILSNFTQTSPLKDSAHGWDEPRIPNLYENFQDYIKNLEEQWSTIKNDLKEFSPKLYKKIASFLWEKDSTVTLGWSSVDGLQKWCNNENDPFEFKVDDKIFKDIVNTFKNEVEIRRDNAALENIFIQERKKLGRKFKVELIKLKGKTFYTDVESFKNALAKIFSEIQKRPEFPYVTVEAEEEENGKYLDIMITHKDSKANVDAKTMLKEVIDGDFLDIKNNLINLCDWSIESSYENSSYRINYLRSNNIAEIEKLDYQVTDFKHILRFYNA